MDCLITRLNALSNVLQVWFSLNVTYFTIIYIESTVDDSNMSEILSTYRHTLTGRIEYSLPDRSEKQFRGYFKLETDPKGQDLSFANLLLRGTRVANTDWYLLSLQIQFNPI